MITRLKYLGKMGTIDGFKGDLRMWNIDNPKSPYHKSTRMLEGLLELDIVKCYCSVKTGKCNLHMEVGQ
jgi:hypothetical protein